MSDFYGKRVTRSHTIFLDTPPEKIFPLFTPEGEKKWAEGWDYELIYPTQDSVEVDYVFTTTTHDHNQRKAIWLVNCYMPEEFLIEYLRVEPGIKIGRIQIICKPHQTQQTAITVSYTYTGLSPMGNTFIANFSAEDYQTFINTWQKALKHYLDTGKMLTAG